MYGVLLVVKPPGMTSHDVVQHIRRLWKVKVGHTGTLDPAAAGLLVLCLGPATRLAEYLVNCDKTYRAEITFGLKTTTADVEGAVTQRQSAEHLTADAVRQALAAMTGSLAITVPAYSAVKQDGRKLYEWARRDQPVVLPIRDVQIYRWELMGFTPGEHPAALTEVECSKGTYVRSLAEMVGDRLGVGAYLSFLVRTRVGLHRLAQAWTLEQLQQLTDEGTAQDALLTPLAALAHLPQLRVDEPAGERLRYGNPQTVPARPGKMPAQVAVVSSNGVLLCIAEAKCLEDRWLLQPKKVFDWPVG